MISLKRWSPASVGEVEIEYLARVRYYRPSIIITYSLLNVTIETYYLNFIAVNVRLKAGRQNAQREQLNGLI